MARASRQRRLRAGRRPRPHGLVNVRPARESRRPPLLAPPAAGRPRPRPTPLAEPPYQPLEASESAPAALAGPATLATAVHVRGQQDELPLTHLLASGLPASPQPPAGTVSAERLEEVGLPDPTELAARLAQGIVEALIGERPISQLAPWTTRHVQADLVQHMAYLRRLAGPTYMTRSRVAICRVRVTRPAERVAEVCVVVRNAARRHALALRLEYRDRHWVCTELEFC